MPPAQDLSAVTSPEVAAVLARIPEPALTTLLVVRAAILSASPSGLIEKIGYGVPAFLMPGKNGKLLAGYAAGKNFCSYYPMSGRVIHKLASDLAAYETTSGSIHYPLDKPLPKALIKKLVQARLAELEAKR